MSFYIRTDLPRSLPQCCGVLEIGNFRSGSGTLSKDKWGEYLDAEGSSPKECAEKIVKQFISSREGYLLMMNFYRHNNQKEYTDDVEAVESDDLEEEFECRELMDAFEAAGAKEIATFINPNSLNEVRTLVYTAGLVSLEKK